MDHRKIGKPGLLVALLVIAFSAGVWTPLAAAQTTDAPDPALREYLSGNGLLNRGMNELAVEEYRKFLAAHANHEKALVARYGLSVALLRLGKYDEVITELEKIAGKDDFTFAAEVQLMLGQSQLQKQNFPAAATALQKLVDKFPTHDLVDDAAGLLVEAYYRDGKFKSVQSPCDLLISKQPQSPLRERAEFFAGLARMAQDDYTGAAKAFQGMQERYPQGEFADRTRLLLAQSLHRTATPEQAVAQYQEVIKKASGDSLAEALLGLATLQQQQGKNDEAGKLLDQLLQQFPQHKLAGQAQMLRGRVWFDGKVYDKAFESFTQAAKVDGTPRDEVAYWLAKCQMRQGDSEAAASRLTEAMREFPQSKLLAEMSYDRAVSLMRAGKSNAAADALRDFRTKFPAHALAPDAIYMQAMIAHEKGKYADSLGLCRAFLKDSASHPLASAVSFLAAENEFLDNHMPEAAEAYRQFIDQFPKDEQLNKAKFRLGAALYRQDKLDESQALLTKLVDGRKTEETYRRGLLMLGDIAFRNQKWSEAAALLGDYASFGFDQPSADDALLKMGLALARQDKSEEALKAFDELIVQFPKSPHRVQGLFERGQILLARKDLDGASAAFTQVLEDGKESRFAPYATNHLAAIAMQRQDFTKAAELYAQVSTVAANSEIEPEAMFQRGQSLMALKQFEPARRAFDQFLQKYASNDRVPQAQAQRAIALARQGEQAEALKAIELAEQSKSKLDPSVLAVLGYEKAWCLRELGKTDEAAKAYRDMLAAHNREPISAHAMLELAEIESNAKHHKEAAELLDQLRKVSADASFMVQDDVKEPALYRLTVARYELGEFDRSAALGEEFVKRYPQSAMRASAEMFCGESLFKTNRHAQAAEHFAQVVEKYPDDPACATSLLRLGECQAALGKWEDSEKSFASYLKKFSNNELWFQAKFGVGFAKENQNKHDEAMAMYREVIDRHSGPTAARAQFQIGECFFAKKQYNDAVRELLKVDILYGYPEWSAAALYEAGRCFEELSKPAEARTQFEQVQQKYPQSQWATLAAQRLTAITNRNASGG